MLPTKGLTLPLISYGGSSLLITSTAIMLLLRIDYETRLKSPGVYTGCAMSGREKRLMVMAGGTGGHVFPGLAVAHHLMDQGWQVRWLGTADRMEVDLVPKTASKLIYPHLRPAWQRVSKRSYWRRCVPLTPGVRRGRS